MSDELRACPFCKDDSAAVVTHPARVLPSWVELAHYFRDMSARAGVRYDLVETENGLTATARFPEEE